MRTIPIDELELYCNYETEKGEIVSIQNIDHKAKKVTIYNMSIAKRETISIDNLKAIKKLN